MSRGWTSLYADLSSLELSFFELLVSSAFCLMMPLVIVTESISSSE